VIMSAIYALHAVALAANKGGLLELVLSTVATSQPGLFCWNIYFFGTSELE